MGCGKIYNNHYRQLFAVQVFAIQFIAHNTMNVQSIELTSGRCANVHYPADIEPKLYKWQTIQPFALVFVYRKNVPLAKEHLNKWCLIVRFWVIIIVVLNL